MKMTRENYLQFMGNVVSGDGVIVKIRENTCPHIRMIKKPYTIVLPDKVSIRNKHFKSSNIDDGDMIYDGGMADTITFDIRKLSNHFGYDLEEFQLFIQRMLLYHEIGHAIFSPPFVFTGLIDEIEKNNDYDKKEALHTIMNFVEDARVESRLSMMYPPVKNKLNLMSRLFLSDIDMMKCYNFMKDAPKIQDMAHLVCLLADGYYYGFSDKEPQHPAVKKCVEVYEYMWSTEDTQYERDVTKYSIEIYNLIKDIEAEDIRDDVTNMSAMNGENTMHPKDAFAKKLVAELQRNMSEFKKEVKSFGISLHDKHSAADNMKYLNHALKQTLYQALRQIMGATPSKKDVIDYDGHSLDMEGVLCYMNDPYSSHKLYENRGKRDHPELRIVFAIDSSGSMNGDKIINAKRSVMSFASACDMLDIKTGVCDFNTESTIDKLFDQCLDEAKIGLLNAEGGTVIADGVACALKMFEERKPSINTRNALIVLSDGIDDTAAEVGRLLSKRSDIQFYMIGLDDDVSEYVAYIERTGGKCYGQVTIKDSNSISEVMSRFVKMFVRSNY